MLSESATETYTIYSQSLPITAVLAAAVVVAAVVVGASVTNRSTVSRPDTVLHESVTWRRIVGDGRGGVLIHYVAFNQMHLLVLPVKSKNYF